MLPRKDASTKLTHLLVSFVFLSLLIFVQQSCKKTDIASISHSTIINDEAAVDKFLTIPTNINPTVSRIINTIRQQEEKYHFLNKIIANEGFALWQNARIMPIPHYGPSGIETPTTSIQANDTIVLIPLVLENTTYVNSFISCNVNDTVQVKLYRGRDYSKYSFDKNCDTISAHKIALTCMNLEYEAFQHKVFNIKDKRLLNYRPDGKVPSKTTLTIKPPSTTPQSWVTIFYSYDIEVEDANPFEVLCPEGQTCQWTHTETVYDSYVFWISDFGNWNGADFPEDPWATTGGQGGGYNPPCSSGCTPVIDSWEVVTDPIIDGYNPNIADNIMIDTSISDHFPCLDSLLQNLPNVNAEAQKLLWNVFGIGMRVNLNFQVDWALDSLNTTSAYTTPGYGAVTQPSGTFYFFDTVKLNPYVVQYASKEYLVGVIYHESVHAYINYRYNQWQLGLISEATFINEFSLFWPNFANPLNQNERIQHEQIALSYTNTISDLIKHYFNPSASTLLKNQLSNSIAWEGLRETTVWKFPGMDTCRIIADNIAARNTTMVYTVGGGTSGCPSRIVRYDSLGLSLPCH